MKIAVAGESAGKPLAGIIETHLKASGAHRRCINAQKGNLEARTLLIFGSVYGAQVTAKAYLTVIARNPKAVREALVGRG
jgi:hypothetical protein